MLSDSDLTFDEHGCPGYSDKAIIDDSVTWAVVGKGLVTR